MCIVGVLTLMSLFFRLPTQKASAQFCAVSSSCKPHPLSHTHNSAHTLTFTANTSVSKDRLHGGT